MQDPADHKAIVREEFTRQRDTYAANSSVSDPERIARLMRAVNLAPEARVLEVATGPGYVALGFATVCREVVGVDLTEAPLVTAEKIKQEHGLTNVSFQLGDAENLPFEDGGFDVVVCRLAFHHFEDPSLTLREMIRVCQPDGTVAVEDLIVSEHPSRGEYQNRFEWLRDPSHTRALSLGELIELYASARLEVEVVYTDRFVPEVGRWLNDAQTPSSRAAEARVMIERDTVEDLSGARPFVRDGKLHFIQRTAAVIGRRLDSPQTSNGHDRGPVV